MNSPSDKNEKPMKREEPQSETLDRLREEITILRIEGKFFCFDKHEAKRRGDVIRSVLKDADGTPRPISIDVHPRYGQPSILAYKVVQAIFLKLTQLGEPYPNIVAFTQRELARLVGRKWGTSASQQLYHAMMQLQKTGISCTIQNKETKESVEVSFVFMPTVLFSSKDTAITECVVQIHDVIVASLNRHHAIWLNNAKLSTLDPIASVIYKRLFFHFSNTYTVRTSRSTMKFQKDYEAICDEWLGGLKPEKYKSRIEKQLGRYLDAVRETGLISRYEIGARTKEPGFKIVFYPGEGFFEDYTEFYVRTPGQTVRLAQPVRNAIDPQPLQLVAYFHALVGHKQDTFADKEKKQASELLSRYSEAEVRSLINYAVSKIRETNFKPDFFGAVMSYRSAWSAYQAESTEVAQRRAVAAGCPICDGRGWVLVKSQDGQELARQCNHAQAIGQGDGNAVTH